jgi:hypothetical protein
MSPIVRELQQRLENLDPATARIVEQLVREALDLADAKGPGAPDADWPAGYFERTAGALAGEPFDRPAQGESPVREGW